MKKYHLQTTYKKCLADTHTPVSIYLKLRDKFANTILLESSDYHGVENSFSYICFSPIASFQVKKGEALMQFFDEHQEKYLLDEQHNVPTILKQFTQQFEFEKLDFPFITNGIFGYTTYDAVRYFENIEIKDYASDAQAIPEMWYQVYQYIIAINHFKNELYIFAHTPIEPLARFSPNDAKNTPNLAEIEGIINNKNFPAYHFSTQKQTEQSNINDEDFLKMVQKGKDHCQRGDVFQIVLSRQFQQTFQGDEFNVYRALRSINPSPYLFYFDFGNFKIFGSSPEAQLVIKNQKAEIHPIAGTFKRTGNDLTDAALAQKLADDEKESAEHVMLVDLARNDLSRNGYNVVVENFKEIQYYSHLIHLVSKVTAELHKNTNSLKLFADTFPAGTLSGAPKYRAMQLINQIENQNRGFYGGAIGFLSFEGDLNHAIMIRSFLSKNNTLYFQAGAGVVFKSSNYSELNEVNHKLAALRKAIQEAENL